VRVRVDVLGCMFVRNAFSTVRWNLTQQAVSHLRTAIIANPQHGDAKYFLALQLMKSARGFTEAADLLSSIALSSPQEPRTVFDFSPVDVLLLAGQAHEKVGNLSEAAGSFHNAASWYATAAQEQWEVVCLPSSQIAPLPQAVALARALALSLSSSKRSHLSAACVRACLLVLRIYICAHQDNAQQFKFGLAYYNLARMLGLQGLWEEAL
jgi:tetratricopeptide (TPR) repeat protein